MKSNVDDDDKKAREAARGRQHCLQTKLEKSENNTAVAVAAAVLQQQAVVDKKETAATAKLNKMQN